MTTGINKINFIQQTNSQIQLRQMQKSSGSESIFDMEKAARTKGSEKTPDYSGADAKSATIMEKIEQTKSLKEAKIIIDKLIQGDTHDGVKTIANNLTEKYGELTTERGDILAKLIEYSISGMPPEELESKLDELLSKASQLVNKVTTFFSNTLQAEKLNEGVKKYIEDGGDPDKIDLEKFNESMMPNSDIDSIANGSQNGNSAGTAAGDAQENQGSPKAGLTKFFQQDSSTPTQNTDNNQTNPQAANMTNPFDSNEQKNKFKFGFFGLNNA